MFLTLNPSCCDNLNLEEIAKLVTRFYYLIFDVLRYVRYNGTNIIIASTVTISRFGPSGSLARKNTNLEITKEIIRRINI